MKVIKRSVMILFLSISLISCEGSNEVPIAKKTSIEFPYELLFDETEISSDYFTSDNYYLFNPSSVYLRNEDVYLLVDQGVYSFKINSKNDVTLNYSVKKESFEYLNYNHPGSIVPDSFKNLYVENIRMEEKFTVKGNKKKCFIEKTNHRVFKFDYEGNFLYSIGPNGKNDSNHFGSNETLELMHVDEFDNLSIIIKSYEIKDYELNDYYNVNDSFVRDVDEFVKDNVDSYKYRFMRFDSTGEIIYTLDLSDLAELNIEKENIIRVIQSINITSSGDQIIISVIDQHKINISENEYYVEPGNSTLLFYDLNYNKLSENSIGIENDLYYVCGLSTDDKIFLCHPDDVYGMRFIVINFNGQIQENKKIIINNIRQRRYDFFFNREGYIATIFLEDEKVRITQYR